MTQLGSENGRVYDFFALVGDGLKHGCGIGLGVDSMSPLSCPLFLLVFLACTSACVPEIMQATDVLIKNGGVVRDDNDNVAIRSVALIGREKLSSGRSFCTGTVIANDIVLTAAHCFMDINPAEVVVVFAREVKGVSDDKIRQVINVISHEDFRPAAALGGTPGVAPNDIALVRFAGSIPAPYVITPILRDVQKIPNRVTLVGYGLAEEGQPETVGYLRAVDVNVVDINPVRKVIGTMGDGDARALPGDSGGAAMVWLSDGAFVAGVDSTGGSMGGNTYTAVSFYSAWVDQALEKIHNSLEPVSAPLKIVWNTPDIERGMKQKTSDFTFVASNKSDVPGDCRLIVRVLRRFLGAEVSYSLLSENGLETLNFAVEAQKPVFLKFTDPRAEQNDRSSLVEINLGWSCNGSGNKNDVVRVSPY